VPWQNHASMYVKLYFTLSSAFEHMHMITITDSFLAFSSCDIHELLLGIE
jgi:hypothetical protein